MPDIFTDLDATIFSDGSLDPMGLRVIWTSLGSRIFANRLNTVSTDIRLYTINLFHHHVIRSCEKLFEEHVNKLVGTGIYNSRQDIRDGLIIFLESLLAHTLHIARTQIEDEAVTVLGMTKLTGLKNNKPNDRRVLYLEADKQRGILTRQILLGIHGRHKGPFLEMGLLYGNDYYAQENIWQEVAVLFQKHAEWKALYTHMVSIIERLLKQKLQGGLLTLKVKDVPVDLALQNAYYQCLKRDMFSRDSFIHFWEGRLGLHAGAAGNLYRSLQALYGEESWATWQQVFEHALQNWTGEGNEKVKAICAIEPLLTFVDKLSKRLLMRNTTVLDDEIYRFVQTFLESGAISPEDIASFLSRDFLDEEALSRLKKLYNLYLSCDVTNDYIGFARQLIGYHKEIVDQRGNLAWITVNASNQVTLHRSIHYSEELKKELQTLGWINNYYLSTLYSLHQGLYHKVYAAV